VSLPAFTANFGVQSGLCTNNKIFFSDSSQPTPISVIWRFGDGTQGTGNNIAHTYTTPGNYSVTFVGNFGACSDSVTKVFTVANKPAASFTSTGNTKSCQLPDTIQFNNASTGGSSYLWDFGNGDTSTQINPSETYINVGVYNVSLIVQNTSSCSDTLVALRYVMLGPPVIDSLTNSPYLGCAPALVNFKPVVTSGNPITSYTWDFGDGSPGATLNSPSHKYVNTGVYNVTLVVRTASGCTDSAVFLRAVILGTAPVAKFMSADTNSCASAPVQFTDESSGPITNWSWVFGDGGVSSQQNPLYTYTDTGYFSVLLVVSSNGCSDSVRLKKYIHIKPPIAKFGFGLPCGQKLTVNFFDSSIGASSWSWDFGDGQTSAQQNPQHIYSKAGTYHVILLVTNGTCSASIIDTLTVTSFTPSFTFTPPKTNICHFDTIQFTAKNYDTIYLNYLYWNFGDGSSVRFFSNTPVVSHDYINSGSYSPYLVIQDKSGCNDTITQPGLKINVVGPDAWFNNITGACLNGTTTFNDRSVPDSVAAIVQWIWNFGDGSIDTLSSPPFAHTYTAAGIYDISLKVVDANGCFGYATRYKQDTIDNPLAAFSLLDTIGCLNSLTSFNDLSSGYSIAAANWSFGDGSVSHQWAPQHQYKNLGVYTVGLGITDKFGCKDSITKFNYVSIANAIAAFTLADTFAVCPPLIINPINTSQSYTSLSWDFGDGNTSNLQNPIHTYTTAGSYWLLLTATGHGACSDTTGKLIVLLGPSGTLAYSPVTLCDYDSVKFITKGKNIAGYSWDFGDGTTEVTIKPVVNYTYTTPGNYLPKVIIVDSSGVCHVTLQNNNEYVRVGGVTARFTAQTSPGCDSALVSFVNNSVILFDTVASVTWNFGDGTTSSLDTITRYYYSSKNETVTLKIVTDIGCVSIDTIPLQAIVHQSPILHATFPPAVCTNSVASFSAFNSSVPAGTISWLWQFGNGDSSNKRNPDYIYTVSDTFAVAVTATNEFGCSDSLHGSVIVEPLPLPTVKAGTDSTVCLGQSITLQPSGADSYVWTADPTLSCTACTNTIATPDSTQTYYVLGTNSFGCNAKGSVLITVKTPFTMSAAQSIDSICAGLSVQLAASGAQLYTWQPTTGLSNANIANPVASPSTTTTYTVIGSDNKRCFSDTAILVVTVLPNPTVTIPDSNVTILEGYSYIPLSVISPDVIQWQWLPLAGLSCDSCAQPTLSPVQTTSYREKVFNQYGCSAYADISVTVLCNKDNLFVPNTFSPNGDGMNDYFYPRGKGLYSIKSMRIFNRWGQPVFERLNFVPNDVTSAWDGRYKGQPMPSDVYVYVVEVICLNGSVLTSKGTVTLLR